MARRKLDPRDIRDHITRSKLNLMVLGQPPTSVITTPVTLGDDDHVALVDDNTIGSEVTVNLPAAADSAGNMYWIKKLGNTANVIVEPNGSDTLDDDARKILVVQYTSITIIPSSTTNWAII